MTKKRIELVSDGKKYHMYRHEMRPGDVFQYEDPSVKVTCSSGIIAYLDYDLTEKLDIDLGGWGWTWGGLADDPLYKVRANLRVIKHGTWRVVGEPDKKVEPVILPCIDPLERLLQTTIGGITGATCLKRYETAMATEQIDARRGHRPHVSVSAITLSPDQYALAQQCYAEKLKRLQEQERERERCQVVVDLDW